MLLSETTDLIDLYKQAFMYLPEVLVVIAVFIIEAKFINVFERGSLASKIKKASSLGQVVEGVIDHKNTKITSDRRYVSANYKYCINGKSGKKFVSFKAVGTYHQFPDKIKIYYLDDKIFTDYDRDNFRGILFPIIPFVVGAIVMYLRHPELFG